MSKRDLMKVDPLVCQVICMTNIDHFMAVEIRTAYITLANDETLSRAVTRKYVYGELTKLVKRGWLTKLTSEIKDITRFKKTELFDSNVLKAQISHSTPSVDFKNSQGVEQLYVDLNTFKAQLLKGLGEMMFYDEARKKHPELTDKIKTEYMEVNENNHILKGKIRAIEKLITSLKET